MKTGENETPEEDCILSFNSPNGASIDQLDAHHFLGDLREMNGSCTLNLHFDQFATCVQIRNWSLLPNHSSCICVGSKNSEWVLFGHIVGDAVAFRQDVRIS
jgi:hypothetical protein